MVQHGCRTWGLALMTFPRGLGLHHPAHQFLRDLVLPETMHLLRQLFLLFGVAFSLVVNAFGSGGSVGDDRLQAPARGIELFVEPRALRGREPAARRRPKRVDRTELVPATLDGSTRPSAPPACSARAVTLRSHVYPEQRSSRRHPHEPSPGWDHM